MDRREGTPSPADFHKSDELVREYLVFRGFLGTLKALSVDRRNDKVKCVQPERIVEQLQAHVTAFDVAGLLDLWKYLEARFFSRLDARFARTARQLEQSLKRFYLVHCIQSGNPGKCREFFDQFGDELSAEEGWRPWFMLPFLRTADVPEELEPYFSKPWQDLLLVSTHNFLATVFATLPLPQLLQFDRLQREIRSLANTVDAQQRELFSLHTSLSAYKKHAEPSVDGATAMAPKGATRTGGGGGGGGGSGAEPIPSPRRRTSAAASRRTQREDGGERAVCRVVREYKGHREAVQGLRFSSDGTLLACCTRDKVKIFHAALDGSAPGCVVTCDCLTDINCMEWNGAHVQVNKLLLTGHTNAQPNGAAGCVKVWSPEASKCLWEMTNDHIKRRVDALTVNPTGTVCAVASDALQLSAPTALATINLRHQRADVAFEVGGVRGNGAPSIHTMEFNHNGSCLITGADDGHIRLFDVKQKQPVMSWAAHLQGVDCLHWKQDETSVFTVGGDHVVAEWSLHHAGQALQSFPLPPCLIPSVTRGGPTAAAGLGLGMGDMASEDAVEYVGGWADILGHNARHSKYLRSHDFGFAPDGKHLIVTPPSCVLQCGPTGLSDVPITDGRPGYLAAAHWHPTNTAVFAGCGVGDAAPRAYQLTPTPA